MNAPVHVVPAASPTLVKRALHGHAAIGLLASALLYIISLTGVVVVIHDRWQRWEQPNVSEITALSPEAAQAAMVAVLAREAGKPPTTHIYLRLPTEDFPRAIVTTDSGGWYVDSVGHVAAREAGAWTEFVIGLHEYLHLPATWGLILVGALGAVLVALVTTGVLAHPRILRDAFRLRTRHDAQLARADWHNRLGVWTLPFVLAVALTGAFIGLGSVGMTMLARAYTNGDLTQIYAPVYGQEPVANPAAAPLPNIAAALRNLPSHAPNTLPIYLIVHDPRTAGQHIQILAEHPHRLIYGESYTFDARGRWLGSAGLSDGAIGQQVTASAYNLHFGNYGGVAVELAYMLLGLALCVITATGTSLWLEKRRRRGLGGHRLGAGWNVVIWGTPIALVIVLWVRALAGAEAPLAGAFWGLLAAGLAVGIAWPTLARASLLRRGLAGAILVTAVAHLLLLRPTIADAVIIDLVAIALSLLVFVIGREKREPATAIR